MATLNLGKIRPVYQGQYDSALAYAAWDWVHLNGEAWIALVDVPAGIEPGTDPNVWSLFGGKGERGEKGDKGDKGDKGEAGADAVVPSVSVADIDNLF